MWYYFTADLSNDTEFQKWIDQAVADFEHAKALPFVIIDIKTVSIIGSTRIANISEKDSRVEIGWTCIAKKYQGTE